MADLSGCQVDLNDTNESVFEKEEPAAKPPSIDDTGYTSYQNSQNISTQSPGHKTKGFGLKKIVRRILKPSVTQQNGKNKSAPTSPSPKRRSLPNGAPHLHDPLERGRVYRHDQPRASSTSSMVDAPRSDQKVPIASSTPNKIPQVRHLQKPQNIWRWIIMLGTYPKMKPSKSIQNMATCTTVTVTRS